MMIKQFFRLILRFLFEERLINISKEENFYEHKMDKNYMNNIIDNMQSVNLRILFMFLYFNNLLLEILINYFYKNTFWDKFLIGLLGINIISLVFLIILVYLLFKKKFQICNLLISLMIAHFDLLFIYCLISGFIVLDFQEEYILINFYRILFLNFLMGLIFNIIFYLKAIYEISEAIFFVIYKIILFVTFLFLCQHKINKLQKYEDSFKYFNYFITPEICNIMFYSIICVYFLFRRKLFYEEIKRIFKFKTEKCNYYQNLLNMLNKSFLSFNKSTYRINSNNSFINFLRNLGLSDKDLNSALDIRDLTEYNRVQKKKAENLENRMKNENQSKNIVNKEINLNNSYFKNSNTNLLMNNNKKQTFEKEFSNLKENDPQSKISQNLNKYDSNYNNINNISDNISIKNLKNNTIKTKNNLNNDISKNNSIINNSSLNNLVQIYPSQILNQNKSLFFKESIINKSISIRSKLKNSGNLQDTVLKNKNLTILKGNTTKKLSTLINKNLSIKSNLKHIDISYDNKINKNNNFYDNSRISTNPLEELFIMKLDFLLHEIFNYFFESSNYLNKLSIKSKNKSTLSDYIREIFYSQCELEMDDNFLFQGIFTCDINDIRRERLLNNVNLNSNQNLNSEEKDNRKEIISIEVYSRKINMPEGELIEFYFNDISNISKVEMERSENKIKSLFLAKISHEFKTPLITIIYILKNHLSIDKALKSDDLCNEIENESLKITNENKKSSNRQSSYDERSSIEIYRDDKISNNDSILNSNQKFKVRNIKDNYKKNNYDYKKNIIDLSNYMLSLINDIIDFSVIDSSLDLKFHFYYFDLHKMLNFGFRIMKILIDCKGLGRFIKPIIEIDENVPNIFFSDEMRIKQVLLNLVSNSIKFTRRGYIKIAAKLIDIDIVEISIEDSGIGISANDLNKIFMDFGKLNNDESLKLNKMGSGLGLSISRKIVSTLGTNIQVESQQNIKTRFFFGIMDKKKKSRKISIVSNISKIVNDSYRIKNIENEIIPDPIYTPRKNQSKSKNFNYNEKTLINEDLNKLKRKNSIFYSTSINSFRKNVLFSQSSNFNIIQISNKFKDNKIAKFKNGNNEKDQSQIQKYIDNILIKKFSENNNNKILSKEDIIQKYTNDDISFILNSKNNYSYDDVNHKRLNPFENNSAENKSPSDNEKSSKKLNKQNILDLNYKNEYYDIINNQRKYSNIDSKNKSFKNTSLLSIINGNNSLSKKENNIPSKIIDNKIVSPKLIKSYSKALFPLNNFMNKDNQNNFDKSNIIENKITSENINYELHLMNIDENLENYKVKYELNSTNNNERYSGTSLSNNTKIFNKNKNRLKFNLNKNNFCEEDQPKLRENLNLESYKSAQLEISNVNQILNKLNESQDTILQSPKNVLYFDIINEKIISKKDDIESKFIDESYIKINNCNYPTNNNKLIKKQSIHSFNTDYSKIRQHDEKFSLRINDSFFYYDNSPINDRFIFKNLEIHKNLSFNILSYTNFKMKEIDSEIELFFTPIKKYFKKITKYEKLIIIVDDNEIIRHSIKRVIKSVNKSEKKDKNSVICLADGIELIYLVMIDRMMNSAIKLIISDEQMIYLNGSDCFNILKNMILEKKINNIPFIFCTSNNQKYSQFVEGNSSYSYSNNVDHAYLNKPPSKLQIKTLFECYDI